MIRRRRRYEKRRQEVMRAQEWQRRMWEWQQQHPGVPVMEARITRDETLVRWNGPQPTQEPRMSDETQMPDGSWRPAAPMPLFYGWLFWLKGRYGCSCGRRFYRLATYETHWLTHRTQETDPG